MNTFPLSQVPQSLGAWDAIVTLARRQNEENASYEAQRQARIEQNYDELSSLVAKGDLSAFVYWAKRSNPQRAETLSQLLWEALEADPRLQAKVVALLVKDEELRRETVLRAAISEVEYA